MMEAFLGEIFLGKEVKFQMALGRWPMWLCDANGERRHAIQGLPRHTGQRARRD
jgi:hypothetical protein